MKKIALPTSSPEPLTIEKSGKYVILQQHLSKLKLGKEIAKWVYEALKKADPAKEPLFKDGIGALEVFRNQNGVWIAGVSSCFQLSEDAYKKIIEWFDDCFFTVRPQ